MSLEIALKARLPVLRASTSDIVNLPEVLEHLAPNKKVAMYAPNLMGGEVLYSVDHVQVDSKLYTKLVDANKTLLLINQDDDSGLALNMGEVPVPRELLIELVQGVCTNKATAKGLMVAFKGLTLKAASETISLVRAQGLPLTVANVLHERSQMVGKLKGLALVDVNTACYLPNPLLSQWVKAESPYFHGATDPRLVPRGLLFDGIPGTGKTQGAKYIAREFGVSLYRLDMASSLAKWVGESEANFGRVLSALDQEEPCVFLIDEVEKLFESGGEDAGTTSRILSQLLWWLQEHQSRILTVMTTNNRGILPAELYRNGRIDRVMTFGRLDKNQALELSAAVCTSFGVSLTRPLKQAVWARTIVSGSDVGITPALVTQIVYDYLKSKLSCLENSLPQM